MCSGPTEFNPNRFSCACSQSLEVLDISYNKLGGPLPEAFAAMGSLRELLLDVNQLSGTLPEVSV